MSTEMIKPGSGALSGLLALGLSTNGLQQWLVSNGVGVMVVLICLACLAHASRGDASKVFNVISLVACSLLVLSLAIIPGATDGVARFVGGLVGIGGGQ